MTAISKVSDITAADLAEYIRMPDPSPSDMQLLNIELNSAMAYMKSYTGQDDLDLFPEFVQVAFVLVSDMWDNRALYVDSTNINKVVESILGLHSVNYL